MKEAVVKKPFSGTVRKGLIKEPDRGAQQSSMKEPHKGTFAKNPLTEPYKGA